MPELLKRTGLILGITFIVWVILDQAVRVVRPTFGAFSRESVQRSPAPYIEFKGEPNALDHNRYGYRYPIRADESDAIKIAFFGGSTGYLGDPPIAGILEQELVRSLNRPVEVANFSVVSSNHRQHLHNIIETRQLFQPDIVVFYGGYNETAQPAFYDPRPGYPYNFFFKNDTSPLLQWLITVSPTFTMLERIGAKSNLFSITPLISKRKQEQVLSREWSDRIIGEYFQTNALAKQVSAAFPSRHCNGPVQFRFFYQPYQVGNDLQYINDRIREVIKKVTYGYDVSDAYTALGTDVYQDLVHVQQRANVVMGKRIATTLLSDKGLARCF